MRVIPKPGVARGTRLALLTAVAVVMAFVGTLRLMSTRAELNRSVASVGGMPVELITPSAGPPGPWPGVVVVHGFSGSRQLMYGLAQTLARNGYAAAVVDLPGHGQNPEPMAMGRGRPAAFDRKLAAATAWLRVQPGVDPTRVALVGHSMGAGAVVRFAASDPEIGATVAISVGLGPRGPVAPDVPRNVLTMAGAWEFERVLDACRAAVHASYPAADAAVRQGSWAGGTARQCRIVPGVEHIAVLFSEQAATAMVRWLDGALGAYPPTRVITTAIPMGAALWLHAAGAVVFLLLAEVLFPRGRAKAAVAATLPRVALGILVVGAPVVAAMAMRFLPGGWIPLLTADYLCGFFALMGVIMGACLLRLGCLVVGKPPAAGPAWRTLVLVAVAITAFALAAQTSWLNVELVGVRRWLAVAVFPAWLVYFLSLDAMLRTRPPGEYFAGAAASTIMATAALVAAVFILRAPSFLVILAPAMVPMFLWLGLYGHWLRTRTPSPWPAAIVEATVCAWLVAAVFPLA